VLYKNTTTKNGTGCLILCSVVNKQQQQQQQQRQRQQQQQQFVQHKLYMLIIKGFDITLSIN